MIFGKYQLLARMRIGGMAEIFKAKAVSQPDRLIAIKRILPSFTDEADYVAMFIDEAKLGLRLKHPHIVEAYELGQVEDSFYMAMEYIPGQELGALTRRAVDSKTPVADNLACYVATCVCDALEHAHTQADDVGQPLGIVHRDVSPQNILISYWGEVKIIDFGIAKSEEQVMKTQGGFFKGKLGYLSPEQASGEPLDRRSDIFSLGVCLYEMLAADRLFKGASDFSTLSLVRKADVPSLQGLNENVPIELQRIVHKALERDPRDRYQTAAEMANDLRRCMTANELVCDAEILGEWMCESFAEELERAASGEPEPLVDADEGTGLAAFDDLEPISSVSELAELTDAMEPGIELGAQALSAPPPSQLRAMAPGAAPQHSSMPPRLRTSMDSVPATPGVPSAPPVGGEPSSPPPLPISSSPAPEPSAPPPLPISSSPAPEPSTPPPLPTASTPAPEAPAPPRLPVGATPAPPRLPVGATPAPPTSQPPQSQPPTRVDSRPPLHTDDEVTVVGDDLITGMGEDIDSEEVDEQTAVDSTPPDTETDAEPFMGPDSVTPIGSMDGGDDPAEVGEDEVEELAAAGAGPVSEAPDPDDLDALDGQVGELPGETQGEDGEDPEASLPEHLRGGKGTTQPGMGVGWDDDEEQSTTIYEGSNPPPGSVPDVQPGASAPAAGVSPSFPPTPRPSAPPGVGPASVPPSQFPEEQRMPIVGTVVALIAIIAIIAGGLFLFGPPEAAAIHITTSPTDAKVSVDGVPVPSSSSPFVVTDLEPKREYTVVVTADDHRSWSTAVTLRPGQVLQLPPIALARVDGAPGPALQPAAAVAAVAPKPAVEAPAEPAAKPADPPASTDQPKASKEPSSAKKPRTTSRKPRLASNTRRPVPRPTIRPAPRPRPSVRPAPRPAPAPGPGGPGGKGMLRINSRPWSKVFIDGRPIGNTPQMSLLLPTGKHRVKLVNPDFGLSKTIVVDIKRGEAVTQIVNLTQ